MEKRCNKLSVLKEDYELALPDVAIFKYPSAAKKGYWRLVKNLAIFGQIFPNLAIFVFAVFFP